jgi:uncharacterized membrane protein
MAEFLRKHHYTDLGLALVVVHVIDTSVAAELTASGMLRGPSQNAVVFAEKFANLAFAAGLLLGLAAWLANRERLIWNAFRAYAVIATFNLLDDVAALVVMAESRKGEPLFMLYDVLSVFVMNIVVFSAWYMIIDKSTQGGGFLFPKSENPDGSPKRAIYLDYLFIAFNVSSTFGPTVEAVLSRQGKVVMMLQTLVSLVIVTVLVARVVSG